MASAPVAPHQGETLAQFLDRAVRTAGLSINAAARAFSDVDGAEPKQWQRTLRRWGSGVQATLSVDNAELASDVLHADFRPFVRGGTEPLRDLLTEALDRLDVLESRLEGLEQQAEGRG